jgi:hypothetical protein
MNDEIKFDEDGEPILPVFAPPVSIDLLEKAAKVEMNEQEQEFKELADALAANREKLMPSTARLHDAITTLEDGSVLFIPCEGENVVVERRSVLLQGKPWLDTRLLVVKKINEETGNITLFDADMKQNVQSNFMTGPARGVVFKIPAKRGNVFGPQTEEAAAKIAAAKPVVEGEKKRGRGRPPGSKNREKAVIVAEKKQRNAARKSKVGRRRKKA